MDSKLLVIGYELAIQCMANVYSMSSQWLVNGSPMDIECLMNCQSMGNQWLVNEYTHSRVDG